MEYLFYDRGLTIGDNAQKICILFQNALEKLQAETFILKPDLKECSKQMSNGKLTRTILADFIIPLDLKTSMAKDSFKKFIKSLCEIQDYISELCRHLLDGEEIEFYLKESFTKETRLNVKNVDFYLLEGFMMEGKTEFLNNLGSIQNCAKIYEQSEKWRKENKLKESILNTCPIIIPVIYYIDYIANLRKKSNQMIDKISGDNFTFFKDRSEFCNYAFSKLRKEPADDTIVFVHDTLTALTLLDIMPELARISIKLHVMYHVDDEYIPWPIGEHRKFEKDFFKSKQDFINTARAYYDFLDQSIRKKFKISDSFWN